MKHLLTLIFTLASMNLVAQYPETALLSSGQMIKMLDERVLINQYESNKNYDIVISKINDSVTVKNFTSIYESIHLKVFYLNNKLAAVTQRVLIDHDEVPLRPKVFTSEGWKEFKRMEGSGSAVLLVAYRKSGMALIASEYKNSYKESVCIENKLKSLQKWLM